MNFVKAFVVGGLICVIGQILIDKTKLTPARILVAYVVTGVFLELLGLYEYLVDFAGAGATVPLTGFGYNLCKGVFRAVSDKGLIGVLCGGFEACGTGLGAAVILGLLSAIVFKPKARS